MPDNSENIGGINVSVGADYSDLSGDFATIQDQAKGAGEGIAEALTAGAEGADKLTESAGEAHESSNELLSTLMEFAGISIGIESLREFAIGSVEAAASTEKATIALGALRGSAASAAEEIEDLKATAQNFGQSFEAMMGVNQRFAALGLSVDQSREAMHAAIEAAAAMNSTVDTTASSIDRMVVSGMAGGRQLLTLGLNAHDLAAAMGVAEASVQQAFRALYQETRLEVVTTALKKFGTTAEQTAAGMEGSWTQLKNSFTFAMEEVGNAVGPVAAKFAGLLSGLLDLLSGVDRTKAAIAASEKDWQLLSVEADRAGVSHKELDNQFRNLLISADNYALRLRSLISEHEKLHGASANTEGDALKQKVAAELAAAGFGQADTAAKQLVETHDRLRMAEFADLDAFRAMTLELQKQAIAMQGAGTSDYAKQAGDAEKLAQQLESLDQLQDRVLSGQGKGIGGAGLQLDPNIVPDMAALNQQVMQLPPSIDRIGQSLAMASGEWQSYHAASQAALDKELAAALQVADAEVKRVSALDAASKEETQAEAIMSKGLATIGQDILSTVTHAKSLGDAFKTLGHDVENVLVGTIGKALQQVIADQIALAAAGKALDASISIAEVQGAAGRAAAAAFASAFEILPYPAAIAAAPGFAASASAGTEAAGAIGGFYETGGWVPSDMIAMVHAGEYVTPADQSSQGKFGPNAGGGGLTIGAIHMHGATQDLVDDVMNAVIKGARRAGANI